MPTNVRKRVLDRSVLLLVEALDERVNRLCRRFHPGKPLADAVALFRVLFVHLKRFLVDVGELGEDGLDLVKTFEELEKQQS